MADIRINNLVKRFGDVVAVRDLNLSIADGEFLVLLGPSGCGKTTTLRSVAGLERQTEGDIFIGPRLVNDLRPGDRDIAMVFQFYALYPHLSAYENIAFPLRAQRTSAEEIDRRVRAVAAQLRIEHLLQRRPRQLSGGEQQRVALGRAMVRRPQVFLMDEPLTNLDAALRADMRAELKHLQQELATTMVYVTHDQVEAMSMSHRIAVMNLGVLQQVGTPLEVYRRPATLFVAGFIGTPPMRLINCTLVGDELVDSEGGFRLRIGPEAILKLGDRQTRELVVGIRPEEVAIAQGENADFIGTVLLREPLGDETIYDLQVGAQTLQLRAPPTLRLAIGDQAPLVVDRAALRIFDRASEQAIA